MNIKDKKGNLLTDKGEIGKRWTEYAKHLYNYPIKTDPEIPDMLHSNDILDLVVTTPDILRLEVEDAIRSVSDNKSAGYDNIPAELLKTGDATVTIIHKICNLVWETGTWPSQWTKSIIVLLPKKGDLQDCSNYRTISLISHPSKVLLRINLTRT